MCHMCSLSFPQFWVEWFGDGTISLVEEEAVRTLKEGLQHRKKNQKNKKLSKRLQEAVREAFKAQKKQVETNVSNGLALILPTIQMLVTYSVPITGQWERP